MNIILFPTRFYPAISGGDFYIQRLGEYFNKDKKENHQILFWTSNALDFGAIHGTGKVVKKSNRYYNVYNNLKIHRWEVHKHIKDEKLKILADFPSEAINSDAILIFKKLCSEMLGLEELEINYFIKMGPILPDLINKLQLGLKKCISFEPHIIHCSYLPYANLLYTLLIAKTLEIPALVTPFLHNANIRYQKQGIYKILSLFDMIFACTEYERSIYEKNGIHPNKIRVLPMGVDLDKFQKDRQNEFLKLYQIRQKMVLFCGYKNFEKGALTILKAIYLISKVDSNFTYVFIGPSTTAFNYQLSDLRKKIPDIDVINITPNNLTGIFDKKKIGAFQRADVFCMPSRSEAYGIAYLEAWATKTPVIAAKFPAMEEIIQNDKGILIDFDDSNQLKDEILKLFNNQLIIKEMGNNGYNWVKNNNNWNVIGKKTAEIYFFLSEKNLKIKEKSENK
jgi:glycosyltransferase involved in cell wall biosynthesis